MVKYTKEKLEQMLEDIKRKEEEEAALAAVPAPVMPMMHVDNEELARIKKDTRLITVITGANALLTLSIIAWILLA